jgi:F0F1-type ATP synthase assembly protein I
VHKLTLKPVRRGIQLQLLFLLVLACSLLILDRQLALSALAGGIIASLAHFWFTWRVFSGAAGEAGQILGTVYRAEVGKIILTVMLFITAFVAIKPINLASLIAAYFITTCIPWLAAYFFADDSKPGKTGDITNVR